MTEQRASQAQLLIALKEAWAKHDRAPCEACGCREDQHHGDSCEGCQKCPQFEKDEWWPDVAGAEFSEIIAISRKLAQMTDAQAELLAQDCEFIDNLEKALAAEGLKVIIPDNRSLHQLVISRLGEEPNVEDSAAEIPVRWEPGTGFVPR
jgi:hypothetical protein